MLFCSLTRISPTPGETLVYQSDRVKTFCGLSGFLPRSKIALSVIKYTHADLKTASIRLL